jgi:peptidoglycan/xylan/chitin deacetylase (PgdA/CDA1 family)
MYHRISICDDQWSIDIVNPSSFESQLQYLRNNYAIVPLSNLLQYLQVRHRSSIKRIAALTFDDGYKDIVTYALPLLNKYHVPATIFLATGYIGSDTPFWWDNVGYAIEYTQRRVLKLGQFGDYQFDTLTQRRATASTIIERLKKLPNESRIRVINELLSEAGVSMPEKLVKELILSWEGVHQLSAAGIDIEAHSVTHPILTNMSLERARREVIESRSDIEKQLNHPVTLFAYPNGDCSPEIVKILKEEGFVGAVTTNPVWITSRSSPYLLGRIMLFDEDFAILKLRLSGVLGDYKEIPIQLKRAIRQDKFDEFQKQ